jgi:uncharacterized membrane protein
MPLAITLHLLAVIIWVGGMFFAYMALRPAAARLEPPVRLALWARVFERFFPWVWLAVAVLLLSGFWMIFGVLGGMAHVGVPVHVMMGLGIVMMLIFFHIYSAPFRRLKQAVAQADWAAGAGKLNQIRILIGINLVLSLVIVCVACAGRYPI